MLIEGYELELCEPGCVPGAAVYSAKAHIDNDVSEVMPYLNAVLNRPFYGENNEFLVWEEGERGYALRPHELAVSMILDRKQAREILDKAVAKINDVWERRSDITPDYTRKTKPRILDILKQLPLSNCGECGLPSCMAFAAQLAEGNRQSKDCPPLLTDDNNEALRGLREMGL